MFTSCTSQPVGNEYTFGGGSLAGPPVLPLWGTISQVYSIIVKMHYYGPCNNLLDCKLLYFIGVPFLSLTCMGATYCNDKGKCSQGSHQESRSPIVIVKVVFQKNIGFVINDTFLSYSPASPLVDSTDKGAYLNLVHRVVRSRVPNYVGVRAPLPSAFNFNYKHQYIGLYHDKALLDYLRFGFPLGLDPDIPIHNNATDNHQSAKEWSGQVREFIDAELAHGALLGSFGEPPHTNFTWAPLMTHPKGQGLRIILDLSFGDFSVNKATIRDSRSRQPS